ncbi:MAG: DUF1015 domain-containing protein [Rhodothermales bacterium]|nr:DUF1015 domain-containing protein [Rhodothermales bacterium]
MATLHAFRALRPKPTHAERIASVPYDVVSTDEARRLAAGNDHSFLHVIRPEIDLPPGTDEHADAVYQMGRDNMLRFAKSDYTLVEDAPSVYIYRLTMDGRAQTGIFGCVSVKDYDANVILKHELTRPAKEDDRTRHILEQEAHAEPVMLTYRDESRVDEIVTAATEQAPLYDFTSEDGVGHTVWRIPSPGDLVELFSSIPKLYVADGHHRCKAASRAAADVAEGGGIDSAPEVGFFPAVLFPMSNMLIMPYNRIIRELPSDSERFLNVLSERYGLVPSNAATPGGKGNVCLYVNGSWYQMELPVSSASGAASNLDVARLGEFVLEPVLGITDPRRDARIDFVGGIRGTSELERLVNSGKAAAAISMYATGIDELVSVSDAGELMPPKSTWFEPKLRSGLLVHPFGQRMLT